MRWMSNVLKKNFNCFHNCEYKVWLDLYIMRVGAEGASFDINWKQMNSWISMPNDAQRNTEFTLSCQTLTELSICMAWKSVHELLAFKSDWNVGEFCASSAWLTYNQWKAPHKCISNVWKPKFCPQMTKQALLNFHSIFTTIAKSCTHMQQFASSVLWLWRFLILLTKAKTGSSYYLPLKQLSMHQMQQIMCSQKGQSVHLKVPESQYEFVMQWSQSNSHSSHLCWFHKHWSLCNVKCWSQWWHFGEIQNELTFEPFCSLFIQSHNRNYI